VTWQALIRQAAVQRFHKTGLCDPFQLAHGDLLRLVGEIGGMPHDLLSCHGYVQLQARVYVPELKMQILVDEWRKS
jgi:hypothetical protein